MKAMMTPEKHLKYLKITFVDYLTGYHRSIENSLLESLEIETSKGHFCYESSSKGFSSCPSSWVMGDETAELEKLSTKDWPLDGMSPNISKMFNMVSFSNLIELDLEWIQKYYPPLRSLIIGHLHTLGNIRILTIVLSLYDLDDLQSGFGANPALYQAHEAIMWLNSDELMKPLLQ